MRNVLFFAFGLLSSAVYAADVFLPEDELILPPLLNHVASNMSDSEDRLNVTGVNGRKHQAKVDEWLDFGDSLDLSGRIAFQIIQKETIQWVGGGVFQGKIAPGSITRNEQIYEVTAKRGWMRVWIKPDAGHSVFRVMTDSGNFRAKDAMFWLSTRPGRTEIYLLSGELLVEATKIPLANRGYSVFEKGRDKPLYISREWDPAAMEVRIASSYPQFVKLTTLAQTEWEADKTTRKYAEYRKKGWRKASRLDPQAK